MTTAYFGAAIVILTACATPKTRLGSEPVVDHPGLKVHPAAYAADHFTFGKAMPIREPNDFEFYFKHCVLIGRRDFFLQTEYGCTPPP